MANSSEDDSIEGAIHAQDLGSQAQSSSSAQETGEYLTFEGERHQTRLRSSASRSTVRLEATPDLHGTTLPLTGRSSLFQTASEQHTPHDAPVLPALNFERSRERSRDEYWRPAQDAQSLWGRPVAQDPHSLAALNRQISENWEAANFEIRSESPPDDVARSPRPFADSVMRLANHVDSSTLASSTATSVTSSSSRHHRHAEREDISEPIFNTYREPVSCERCGFLHLFSIELCTRTSTIHGSLLPELPYREMRRRWNIKYELNLVSLADIPAIYKGVNSDRPQNEILHHLCPTCDWFIEDGQTHNCQGADLRTRFQPANLPPPVATLRPTLTTAATAQPSRTSMTQPPVIVSPVKTVKLEPPRPNQAITLQRSKNPAAKAKMDAIAQRLAASEMSMLKESLASQQQQLLRTQEKLANMQAGNQRPAPLVSAGEGTKPQGNQRRAKEKSMAMLGGDRDEQRQLRTSVRLKDEHLSEDEEEEVTKELKPQVAHHNLFHPTVRASTRTRHGYVASSYIDDDDDEENEVDDDEDDEDDLDDEDDTDWEPSDERTPSPTRKPKKQEITGITLTLAEFQALTARANSASNSSKSPQLDAHDRPLQEHTPSFDIALRAPTHGAWGDVDYLLNTYKPLYDKYKASCGKKRFETIFECYTDSQRTRISRFLTDKENDWTVDRLHTLSNVDFIGLMCRKKGISTTSQTETNLRKIVLKEPLTGKNNWVDFEVDWEDCLKQVSATGKLDDKRLATIYRESIPDPFLRTNLKQTKFHTWQDMHAHMLVQILNSEFLIPWMDDVKTRPVKDKPQAGGGSAKHDRQGKTMEEKEQPREKAKAVEQSATPFNPLTFRNKSGKVNVNPNLKKNMPAENPDKVACCHCGYVHNFLEKYCTSERDSKGTQLEPISKEEIARRLHARWNNGHFFAAIPEAIKHLLSPSGSTVATPGSSAAASQAAVAKINGK